MDLNYELETLALTKAVIFDIDGTLADVREIKHHLTGDVVDYDLYHKLAQDAPPVEPIVIAAVSMVALGLSPLIVTARKAKYMDDTVIFLRRNNIPFDMIFMRQDDDDRTDVDLKRDILKRIRSMDYDVKLAYDDNPEIIDLWVSEGIPAVFVPNRGFDYVAGRPSNFNLVCKHCLQHSSQCPDDHEVRHHRGNEKLAGRSLRFSGDLQR